MTKHSSTATTRDRRLAWPSHDDRDKEEIEASIINALCRWQQSAETMDGIARVPWTAVPIEEAIDQQFIKKTQGASVDGVIRTGTGRVAVEVVRYSPPGDALTVLATDDQLRLELARKFEPIQEQVFAQHNVKLSL
jgi:hypothetical protein